MDYREIRKKYPVFRYESFRWKFLGNDFCIIYKFIISPDIEFTPEIIIRNVDIKRLYDLRKEEIDNLVFNLGLVEMISYWKAACSPVIEIEPMGLNREQITWWKDLIINGMGEYFYQNQIDFTAKNFLTIRAGQDRGEKFSHGLKDLSLVGIGGGKDSAVSWAILQQEKENAIPMLMNKISDEYYSSLNGEEKAEVKRKIDPKLLAMNQQGYLNGHTPFSAYLAFLSILLGALFGAKYLIFSNEASANEETLLYRGKKINHQYSKSFRFEKKFREYSKQYLSGEMEYFSFLRPLSELQIAKIFAKKTEYHNIFLSCNNALKTYSGTKKPDMRWCGKCPKCLFVFAMLYPFMKNPEDLKRIFGADLFDDLSLSKTLNALLGYKAEKPFECVGTKREVAIALYQACRQNQKKLPKLLAYFYNEILPHLKIKDCDYRHALNSWNKNHCLPPKFEKILKKYFQNEIKIP